MNKLILTTLIAAFAVCSTGCMEESKNAAGLSADTYEPSKVNVLPMTFPGKDQTVFKTFGTFKEKTAPKPYKHQAEWVVYMASPGWTDGGDRITERLATDAVAIQRVKQFIRDNRLASTVKVAWLQYDLNPGSPYVESLDKVPDNFIPLFLKPHGPQVDYYVYSPATRNGGDGPSMRYDQWLKPYLPFAKKAGNDYVAATEFQRIEGFDDVSGKYWDHWARHWFIVNPEGNVVDAYFSNLGASNIRGANWPINSLIYHLKLDGDSLTIPQIVTANYTSLYTEPYWNKLDADFRDQIGLGDGK